MNPRGPHEKVPVRRRGDLADQRVAVGHEDEPAAADDAPAPHAVAERRRTGALDDAGQRNGFAHVETNRAMAVGRNASNPARDHGTQPPS